MSPSDFTPEFFSKCLSQHDWTFEMSDDPRAYRLGGENLRLLKTVADARGPQFKKLFRDAEIKALGYSHSFPEVKTTEEKPKQETSNIPDMEQVLKLAYAILIAPLVEAINNLAAANKGCVNSITPPSAPAEDAAEELAPKAAKGRKAKAAKEEPEKAPAKAAESDDDEDDSAVPTGEELAVLMAPLKGTPFADQVKAYKEKIAGAALLRTITDKDILRKMEAKIKKCLEAKAAADEDDC